MIVRWKYQTGGAISSSPTMADGKVYFGSRDYNWYCLDAYSGEKIWSFPIGHKVLSSAAIDGSRVYTGVDDGFVYCLNADTGAEIWRKDIYSNNIPMTVFQGTWQPRSSPIIVGNRLYVGALDGKVYCLNTANGNEVWSFPTAWAIGGSPAYHDGVIFIQSCDRNTYALDATDGTLIWNTTTPQAPPTTNSVADFLYGTPTVYNGLVYVGGGAQYFGIRFLVLNETTGAIEYVKTLEGNTQPINTPVLYEDVLYFSEFMGLNAFNATIPLDEYWEQWIGHQVFCSPAVADDIRGLVAYMGSNSYGISVFNGEDGVAMSTFTTEGQIDSSPAIYDGMLYVGSGDGGLYCFDDRPKICTDINAASNKGAAMWSNETIVIEGKLDALQTMVFMNEPGEPTLDYHPGIPNAEVLVTFTKPDGTAVDVTTTTDEDGYFTVSYQPNVTGTWSWTAWYQGKDNIGSTYAYSYTVDNTVKVASPGEAPPPNGNHEAAGIPVEYIYAAVAVIAIVIIAIGAYAYIKRTKK